MLQFKVFQLYSFGEEIHASWREAMPIKHLRIEPEKQAAVKNCARCNIVTIIYGRVLVEWYHLTSAQEFRF
jgi:hypothetical protein